MDDVMRATISRGSFVRVVRGPQNVSLVLTNARGDIRSFIQQQEGVSIREVNEDNETEEDAVLNNLIRSLPELVARGADLNRPLRIGITLLHCAADQGHVNFVTQLLANGARVDVRDSNGATPLHRASLKGHDEIVSVLLRNNADVHARTDNGTTPLHLTSVGESGEQCASLLIDAKANVNATNSDRHTPLHYAASMSRSDIVSLLLSRQANVNVKDSEGLTPLFLAIVENPSVLCVRDLIAAGADVNVKGPERTTVLHQAAAKGEEGIVELLLQKKANVHAKDNFGETPLHDAARGDRSGRCVRLLLEAGAVAYAGQGCRVWPFISKRASTPCPLLIAASKGNVEACRVLLERGANIDAVDFRGSTVLHYAVLHEDPQQCVRLFVTAGADLNRKNKLGHTPLHVAVLIGNGSGVRVLVLAGAQTDVTDNSGRKPFDGANDEIRLAIELIKLERRVLQAIL